jgi:hypothetical protein
MNLLPTTRRSRTAVAGAGVAALLAVGVPLAVAAPASADTEKRGSCSGSARFDYEVEKDDGRFEVSFEVDSDVVGQQWRLRLFHDGQRYASVLRTTDRDGEADVERDRPNTTGEDSFRARAVNARTGEICRVTIVRS